MNRTSPPARALRRALVVFAGIAAVGGFAVPHAEAVDNTMVSSSPATGSTVDSSPPSLLLTFANPLGATNTVQVACNGSPIAVGSPAVGLDGLSLSVTVPNPLPKGECVVSWQVSQPDAQSGGSSSFLFTIANDTVGTLAPAVTTPGAGSVPATESTTAPTTTSSPGDTSAPGTGSGGPLGLSRLLISLGVAVLFGSLVLIATAWPEGVEYILTVRFLRSAWLLTLAFAIFNAACVTAQISGKGIGSSLSPTSWNGLTDTTPGIAALARVIFVLLTGWVVMRPERVIDPATQLPALALPGLAVATLGFSRSGGQLAFLGYAAGIAHALAMAVWLGGLILLARVVLAGPGEEDLVHAVRGFARISTPALGITIFTGFIQMYRLDWGEIFTSSHGRVLFLKSIAVGVMVFLGVAARQFIKERVARVDAMTGQLAVRLRRAVGIEAMCGVVVLALTAWMLSLSPPKVAATGGSTKGLAANVEISNDQADVIVRFSAVVGPNAVRVEVDKPKTGVAGLAIDFSPPANTTVPAVTLNVPLTTSGVAVLPIEQGIPLGSPGVWTVTVRFGTSPIGSKTVLITDGTTASTGSTPLSVLTTSP
ncbi:MAG: copper resistance protein CopC/CopD [Ilumatobacteraceae bacterium]|nr:copper resistance protein CopC/CopD [Ilumatobacteraceae bacterium]